MQAYEDWDDEMELTPEEEEEARQNHMRAQTELQRRATVYRPPHQRPAGMAGPMGAAQHARAGNQDIGTEQWGPTAFARYQQEVLEREAQEQWRRENIEARERKGDERYEDVDTQPWENHNVIDEQHEKPGDFVSQCRYCCRPGHVHWECPHLKLRRAREMTDWLEQVCGSEQEHFEMHADMSAGVEPAIVPVARSAIRVQNGAIRTVACVATFQNGPANIFFSLDAFFTEEELSHDGWWRDAGLKIRVPLTLVYNSKTKNTLVIETLDLSVVPLCDVYIGGLTMATSDGPWVAYVRIPLGKNVAVAQGVAALQVHEDPVSNKSLWDTSIDNMLFFETNRTGQGTQGALVDVENLQLEMMAC